MLSMLLRLGRLSVATGFREDDVKCFFRFQRWRSAHEVLGSGPDIRT